MFSKLAFLSLFVATVLSYAGVDVSVAVSASNYQCLVGQGYTFAVARCLRSNGQVDQNCASNVQNAIAGGMSNVDIYAFPCFKCGNAAGQINATLTYAGEKGVKFNTFWLDIEGPQYWGSTSANQAFFQEMVSTLQQAGVTIGVYTSSSQWSPIMGSSTAGSSFPLWYAHYDGKQSFSDFTPFGGWSTPAIKQYKETQTVCNVGADLNWYPGGSTSATSSNSNSNSGHSANSNSGHSANSNSGHAASSGPSSNSNSGHSANGPASSSSNGPASSSSNGPSSNGPSSSSSNGPSSNTASSSGYTSSNSGNGEEFKLSDQAIYNQIGGGKLTKEIKARKLNKEVEFSADHFKVMEEKNIKKFN